MDHLNYNKETEELFIRFFLTRPDLFIRCLSIVNSRNYVDSKNRKAIEFIVTHANEHHVLPTDSQLEVVAGKKFEKIADIADSHDEWFLKEYEKFARHKELEAEILASADLLEQGRHGEVETRIRRAVQVGLVKDLGTDYFEDPRKRLEALMTKDVMISSGWRELDFKLHGGYTRGSLNIWAGQSGMGKSLFLQNQSLNFVEDGLHGIYITYELSENLCSMRLDAMVSGYATKDIFKNLDTVELKVSAYGKKNKGSLQIKQLLNGTTANDIRAYVKEYQVQTGRKIDFLAVDYLDLMMPYTVKVSPENAFVKDKFVSEELRNLAIELNIVLVTASQLNRGSYESNEFDASDMAGGISKVNTADNVFAIYTTPSMRENGRYQLQLLKTRSSSGVGSRIDLKFDIASLRIVDLEEGEAGAVDTATKSIVDKLQTTGKLKPQKADAPAGDVVTGSIKLRELLKRNST